MGKKIFDELYVRVHVWEGGRDRGLSWVFLGVGDSGLAVSELLSRAMEGRESREMRQVYCKSSKEKLEAVRGPHETPDAQQSETACSNFAKHDQQALVTRTNNILYNTKNDKFSPFVGLALRLCPS